MNPILIVSLLVAAIVASIPGHKPTHTCTTMGTVVQVEHRDAWVKTVFTQQGGIKLQDNFVQPETWTATLQYHELGVTKTATRVYTEEVQVGGGFELDVLCAGVKP